MFRNRVIAGIKLAEELEREGIKPDEVVSVYPNGDPVGRQVSEKFGVAHKSIIYKELSPSDYPWLEIGAVTSGGTMWLDDFLVKDYDVDRSQLSAIYYRQRGRALQLFKHNRLQKPRKVRGKKVVLVEDGLDNGLGMMACVGQLMKRGAGRITVATPFAPETVVKSLRKVADDVVAVEMPSYVGVVDDCYESQLTLGQK